MYHLATLVYIRDGSGLLPTSHFPPCATYSGIRSETFMVLLYTAARRKTRVARWYRFKPKIQNWEYFGTETVDIFYGHLVHIYIHFYKF
jgi:hypothetical protein